MAPPNLCPMKYHDGEFDVCSRMFSTFLEFYYVFKNIFYALPFLCGIIYCVTDLPMLVCNALFKLFVCLNLGPLLSIYPIKTIAMRHKPIVNGLAGMVWFDLYPYAGRVCSSCWNRIKRECFLENYIRIV